MSRPDLTDDQWALMEPPVKVERCFGWLDNCRRLVVRYNRHLHIYRAFCLLAFILLGLQRLLK